MFGSQTDILNKAIENGWLVTRTSQTDENQPYYSKNYGKTRYKKLDYNISVKPFKTLTVDLRGNRIQTSNLNQQLDQQKKSLENLQKDFRFPKKERRMPEDRGPRPAPSSTDIPAPKEPRKPGEEKIMTPLAKGGRAGYKSGSKGCKLAMKGKGRAYGKNS